MNGLALLVPLLFNIAVALGQQDDEWSEWPQLYVKHVDLSRLPLVDVELGNVTCPDDFYGILAALQLVTFNSADHFEYYAHLTCQEVNPEDSVATISLTVEEPDLVYFPERKVFYIDYAVAYVWLADQGNVGWSDAEIHASFNFDYPSPFSRPKRSPFAKTPQLECEVEQETFDVITFPIVLQNSGRAGVVATFSNFTSPELIAESESSPKISVSLTFYLSDICLPGSVVKYCSIFHAIRGGDDSDATPQLFLSAFTNQLVIQIADLENKANLFFYQSGIFLKSGYAHHILLAVNVYDYQLTVTSWDPERDSVSEMETSEASFDLPVSVTSLSWPDSYLIFGGSNAFRSFGGFIDSATVFRSRFAYSTDSDVVSRQKLSKLGNLLALRLKYCEKVTTEATSCSTLSFPVFGKRRETVKRNVSFQDVYLEGLHLLEKSSEFEAAATTLDMAGCLGSGQAEFLNGVLRRNVNLPSTDQLFYLTNYLKASLMGEHLADLALGNVLLKEKKDYVVAFRYLKSAADVSQNLVAQHLSNDRWVDSIHLNNREELESHQENENGPVMAWLMYQAGMGDAGAMHDMARLFYQGAQGVDRDMERAAALFRQAANVDASPEILYDYAVVLLHGRGVERNRTLALEYLHRAAKAGHGPAYGALGWFYMEKDGGNLTLAVPYLEKAAELNVPEAAHNIGWLLLYGQHPFKPGRHPGLAYGYFVKAAGLGSLEGALMASELIVHGIPSIGLAPNATEACRYANAVASQSPRLGKPLRAALSSYLAGDMQKSFIHYSVAAETGNDIAIFNTGYLCETESSALVATGLVPSDEVAKSCVKEKYEDAASRPFIPITNTPPHALLWLAREATDRSDYDAAADLYADALLNGADEGYYGLAWLAADRGYHIPVDIFGKLILSDSDLSMSSLLSEMAPIDVAHFLLDACMTLEEKDEDEEWIDEDGYLSIDGKMKSLPEGYFSCALYKFYISANQTLREFDEFATWLSGGGFSFVDNLWSYLHTELGLFALFAVGFVIGVLGVFPIIAFISAKLASVFRA